MEIMDANFSPRTIIFLTNQLFLQIVLYEISLVVLFPRPDFENSRRYDIYKNRVNMRFLNRSLGVHD